jgi:hypothetical protein
MREIWCVASVLISALSLPLAGFASTAGAGEQLAAPVTIVKTVSGPVPVDTTFTARIECDHAILDTGSGSVVSATVTFDATGQPTSADTFDFNDTGQCIINETATGGAATVTYACVGVQPVEPPAPDAPQVCPEAGPQSASISVNILSNNQSATVTIANTFVEPEPVEPEPTPSPAVVVQPVFTG